MPYLISCYRIFDNLAECLLLCVCLECAISRAECLRQLDENVFVGEAIQAWVFYHKYLEVAADLNVRLAPMTHDKAFPPQSSGQILGLTYSLPDWRVSLCEQKLLVLLKLLFEVVDCDNVPNPTLQTLNGKLTHYSILGGEFIPQLLHLANTITFL